LVLKEEQKMNKNDSIINIINQTIIPSKHRKNKPSISMKAEGCQVNLEEFKQTTYNERKSFPIARNTVKVYFITK
jgi:hypothetical protein